MEGDLFQMKLASIVKEEGGKGRPMVLFDEKVIEIISQPWKEAFVVKLLGRNLCSTAMKERLRGLWNLKVGYEVFHIGFGYFMIKFDL